MSFNPQNQQPAGAGINLEDRLRGLILSNAQGPSFQAQPQSSFPDQALPPHSRQGTQRQNQSADTTFIPTLPPHMRGASLAHQQEYIRRQSTQAEAEPVRASQQSQSSGKSPQNTHKRPNQHQRRQLAAELAIPIDDKSSISTPRAATGYSPNQRYAHSTHGQPQNNGRPWQQQEQRMYQQHHPQQMMVQPPSGPSFYQPSQHDVQARPQRLSGQLSGPPPGYNQGPPPHQWQPGQQPFINGQQLQQRPPPQNRQLFQPGAYGGTGRSTPYGMTPELIASQSAFLESLVQAVVPHVGVEDAEIAEKEAFRANVEQACRESIAKYEQEAVGNAKFLLQSVQLRCFGSMASGFATKASDMDLALLSPQSKIPLESSESSIPRILEKTLLDMGYGARLLTRTRVPIIKLCQRPTETLRADLLQERLKWENGFDVENPDEDEVVDDELDAVERVESPPEIVEVNNSVVEDNIKSTVVEFRQEKNLSLGAVERVETPPEIVAASTSIIEKSIKSVVTEPNKSPEEVYKEALASFRQKKNLSLGDYYGSAKRLLHQLGGRDVGSAYSNYPTVDEMKILADVCESFINGLESVELKDRLLTYKSMVFERTGNPATAKSLSGVFNQIEGERLAMAWEDRPLPEKNELLDAACSEQIEQWRTLLNCTSTESSLYNRRLHQSLERLKKIPSLQLPFLQHSDQETAAQYYARTAKLLQDLGGEDNPTIDNTTLAIIITHYVNGIKDSKIRETLQVVHSQNQLLTLQTIALHQRILELAHDFEKALAKNLYSASDRPDIEAYITLLRSASTISSPSLSILPVTPELYPLLRKIASLPDPTTASKPRDRYQDHLEFPKTGVGIQCDINFAASLALHNTLLLRCYSLTDARVKPLVLFVKHWAKRRGINTPYRGTLSSYGYVLMVLHYLINIAHPFVCPNLQHLSRDPPGYLPPAEIAAQTTCSGRDVRFWRNEREIADLSQRGLLNHNQESVGALLRGFFEYYAQNGPMSSGRGRGFDWGREVLSLRTQGGLLTKQEKGWVGARTVVETTHEAAPTPAVASGAGIVAAPLASADGAKGAQMQKKQMHREEVKEIRHRYLFALEDPFETDHNVARTVTHNGIVAIREEFRRAWRIVKGVGGRGEGREGGLLDEAVGEEGRRETVREFMGVVHGWEGGKGRDKGGGV